MSKEYPKLPNRDNVTALQISTLLNIAGTVASILRDPGQDFKGVPDASKLDGGAKAALETTLINVCSRLDGMLDDPSRWGFEFQNHLEYKLAELYVQEAAFRAAQTRVADEAITPHAMYKPLLVRLEDGSYAAILGDTEDLENAVTGIGDNPAEALKNFDIVFNGGLPEKMREWLQKRIRKDKNEGLDGK